MVSMPCKEVETVSLKGKKSKKKDEESNPKSDFAKKRKISEDEDVKKISKEKKRAKKNPDEISNDENLKTTSKEKKRAKKNPDEISNDENIKKTSKEKKRSKKNDDEICNDENVKKTSKEKKRSKKNDDENVIEQTSLSGTKKIDQFKSSNPTFDLDKANRPSKKKLKKVKKLDHKHDSKGQNRALRYLEAWEQLRNGASSDWKFEKCRQIWLLANAYNDEKIPDSKFDILLKYMDSIKGKMRESSLEIAKKKVDLEERWSTALSEQTETPIESRPNVKEADRAKEIILMLSDEQE